MLLKLFNNKKGFSLLEIVITIIILGISLSAILESFIVGSASSVQIANEVTATNLAKQYIADLNYCSEGGGPVNNSSGGTICNNFNSENGNGNGNSIWNANASNSSLNPYITSPQGPVLLNNYCFYTTITPTYYSTINSANGNASIYINGQPNWTQNSSSTAAAIAIVVNTGWYTISTTNGITCAPTPPATYSSVTLTTIFTNY